MSTQGSIQVACPSIVSFTFTPTPTPTRPVGPSVQTGLIWHQGAMLYYAGDYHAAVQHLGR